LTGVATADRKPLRDGAKILVEGDQVGILSSGNYSPVLEHGIGMGLLEPGLAPGQPVTVMLRGREIEGTVVALPFVKKES
jgi:aminomethyltransferase